MKPRRRVVDGIAAFGWLLAWLYVGCITPERADYSSQTNGKISAECLACVMTPDAPGPGCGDEFTACLNTRTCSRDFACSQTRGCFGGTVAQLLGCSVQYCSFAFEGPDDPGRPAALAAFTCLTRGACAPICFTDAGDGGTAPSDAADTGVSTQDADDAAAGTACLDGADEAILSDAAKVQAAEGTCGLQCFGQPAPDCNATCVAMQTGLSNECAKCWGGQIDCITQHCIADCAGGDSPACRSCTAQFCGAAFHACSGL